MSNKIAGIVELYKTDNLLVCFQRIDMVSELLIYWWSKDLIIRWERQKLCDRCL